MYDLFFSVLIPKSLTQYINLFIGESCCIKNTGKVGILHVTHVIHDLKTLQFLF